MRVALVVLVLAGVARAQEEAADISPVKGQLKLLADGKKHYLAVVPFVTSDDFFFWGDGKTFWAQRTFSGSRVGNASFSRAFWEPRVSAPYKASFDFRDGKYTLRCDERKTEFTPLPEAEAKAMLDGAKWMKVRWKRQPYALARDDKGVYYYVDRMRAPAGNKNFRLFVGPKGKVKLQKMINVVSDSEGDIFATRTGELRLVLGKNESTWIARNARTKLVIVPVEDNRTMVYAELGVYTGESLGTPCDEL